MSTIRPILIVYNALSALPVPANDGVCHRERGDETRDAVFFQMTLGTYLEVLAVFICSNATGGHAYSLTCA